MGPLAGIRIIEMAGIGPAPFAAMMLSDMGAEVVRVDRREAADLGIPGRAPKFEVLHRGRSSIAVDVKADGGRKVIERLITKADAIIEGFRPGVMERLGLGPDTLLKINPKLVFGRMTGFGQDGPLANQAGHDINYIALAGVLHAIGRKGEAPVPPLNLVGDFGGGGMLLAFGVVCALLEAQRSGRGQVVDAAMVDGSAALMGLIYGLYSQGTWKDERGVNILDTGSPWYGTYATKDGKWLAVGAIEKRFYEEFVQRLGLELSELPRQHDRAGWPDLRRRFAEVIASKTRSEWEKIFEGSDACVAPVLSLAEVESYPHNKARKTFLNVDGVLQPAPAPRFSRTVPQAGQPARQAGSDTERVLADWGFAADEIKALKSDGVVGMG
ncbi:MAG TPA: CaiB/BaiF CoA-transferase family protein [Hyphomicrobiaceae bacterium]|jgi:alpha-methylacyl-CoA racemase|nr:CaiB/BaiF CoA-transferase family protein [Hyphomicrobiaceae bacterium]